MIYLAPMQGLTEITFRKAYYKVFGLSGIDMAISPFISLTHGTLANAYKKIKDVLPEYNAQSLPLIPQILGNEIPQFIEMANRLGEIGYDEVNWNMGCPVTKVAHKKRGSGLLPYPDVVDNILSKVLPNVSTRISLKIRLGYYSPDEVFNLVSVFNRYPLANVVIHPRIGLQMYEGDLFLDVFAQAVADIKHKIIFNGDIFSVADYAKIQRLFPTISDVMIGRGAVLNPLLPLEIKGQTVCDYNKNYVEFVNSLFDEINARNVPDLSKLRKTKEYWQYFAQNFDLSDEDRREVLLSDDLCDTQRMIIEKLSKSDRISSPKL